MAMKRAEASRVRKEMGKLGFTTYPRKTKGSDSLFTMDDEFVITAKDASDNLYIIEFGSEWRKLKKAVENGNTNN